VDDRRGRPSDDECYRSLASRDARFDGRFFFGVTSTGIYCRPICPARTPRRAHVRVFDCAAAAAAAGFRPCLRCRPETSPGTPAWSGTRATVTRALQLIDEGGLDAASVGDLADRLGVGERHLRRLFDEHLGVSPGAVARTRRVHFAKRLLDETDWPMTEVAQAAGFASLRRFNATLRETYGCPPGELRRRARQRAPGPRGEAIGLRVAYRPPFAFADLLAYLAPRALPGVEEVGAGVYRRSVQTAEGGGVVEIVDDSSTSALRIAGWSDDARPIAEWVARARRLFDCTADPAAIASVLEDDPRIGPRLARRPGLRVPGAWCGFEVAVRVILGQQVSVAGATTLAGRLIERFGEPLGRPSGAVTHRFPTPERLARADLASIGLPGARADALRRLARAVAGGRLALDGSTPPDAAREALLALPGVGSWTAEMIALRALGDPDAFPSGDLGLRRAAADGSDRRPSARALEAASQAWRPWRAYAAMALWSVPEQVPAVAGRSG
jgi:AraC family transcriptional regulator of adaptative response / DNA-3-methyladenine glycosylase II